MSTSGSFSSKGLALSGKIRWSQTAHEDFLAILSWIEKDNPEAASQVGRTILELIDRLTQLADRGRRGAVAGTREKVVGGLPYIVVFRVHHVDIATVDPVVVEIVNIRHGAKRWPPGARP